MSKKQEPNKVTENKLLEDLSELLNETEAKIYYLITNYEDSDNKETRESLQKELEELKEMLSIPEKRTISFKETSDKITNKDEEEKKEARAKELTDMIKEEFPTYILLCSGNIGEKESQIVAANGTGKDLSFLFVNMLFKEEELKRALEIAYRFYNYKQNE